MGTARLLYNGTFINSDNKSQFLIAAIKKNLQNILYFNDKLESSDLILEKAQRFFRRISEWKSRCLGQRCRWPLNMINWDQVSWRRHFITSFVGDEPRRNSSELYDVWDRRNYSIRNFLMGEIFYHISPRPSFFVMGSLSSVLLSRCASDCGRVVAI